MESFSQCLDPSTTTGTTTIIATTVAATLALMSLGRFSLWSQKPKVFPGPLTTAIPRLSETELAKVTYQPDHFPGARDVPTPVSIITLQLLIAFTFLSSNTLTVREHSGV
jgi:hypothetical protein